MKIPGCLAVLLAMFLAPTYSPAATYTMGYPPVGGANITFSGSSIGATGATYAYTNFNGSAYQQLYWGVNFVANVAQSDVLSPGNMVFYSYNPSTGLIAFVSTQDWTFIDGFTSSPVSTSTQLVVQLQPYTGSNAGFLGSGFLNGQTTTKGALGIGGNAGEPLYQIVSAGPYQATFEFETWDGTAGNIGQGLDVADFYANHNGGSNASIMNTSVDFEFWWSIQKTTAKLVQVGTCKTSLHSYVSIQSALSAVPSGATIQICPGTYPEQLTIDAPVSLQGIADGANQAVILTVPNSGLTHNGTGPISSVPIFSQILVQDVSPVNISGLTVDGSSSSCPPGAVAGIVYLSASAASSGKVINSVIRNVAGACGSPQAAAIYGENASGTPSTLTIQTNSLHSINGEGIVFGPNLSGTISGNTITQTKDGLSFQQAGPNVKATGNNVSSSERGVSVNSSTGLLVQTNMLINDTTAIALNDNSSGGNNNVTKNTINEGSCGISKNNAASTDVFLPNTVLNVAAATCP